MQFINIETGEYPLTVQQLKAQYPNTLFPEPFEAPETHALVEPSEQPSYNANTKKLVEIAPVKDGDKWRQAFEVITLTSAEKTAALQSKKSELLASATAKRWEVETGGVTFSDGVRVGTTTQDQNRITTVIANSHLASVATVDFKAESGWVTLTLEELQSVAAAIALHVQACFSAERAHHEAIASLGTLAAANAYDIAQGWPQ